jgi:hypothetical protein
MVDPRCGEVARNHRPTTNDQRPTTNEGPAEESYQNRMAGGMGLGMQDEGKQGRARGCRWVVTMVMVALVYHVQYRTEVIRTPYT